MAPENPSGRRNFIYYLAAGMGALAVGAAVWPLIDSMNPAADVTSSLDLEFNLEKIKPGERATVVSRQYLFFVFRRTADQIKEIREEKTK